MVVSVHPFSGVLILILKTLGPGKHETQQTVGIVSPEDRAGEVGVDAAAAAAHGHGRENLKGRTVPVL